MRTHLMIAAGMTALVVLATAAPAHAQGVVGQRMISLQLNRVELGGDLKQADEYLDDIYLIGATFQLPLGDYFELLANASYMNISGEYEESGLRATLDAPVTAFSGGARVNFLPGQVFNPFIGAAYSVSKADIDVKLNGERVFKDDETEKAIVLTAGAEIALGERAALFGAFSRSMPEGNDLADDANIPGLSGAADDRDTLIAALHFWATEAIVLGITFAQEQDTKTRSYGLNLGLKF